MLNAEKSLMTGVVMLNKRLSIFRILFQWSGSVWQKLWLDVLIYVVLYVFISLLYNFVFVKDKLMKQNFEGFVTYIQKVAAIVPLSFLLGFFVSTVLGRWWSFVNSIPWLSSQSFQMQAFFISKNEAEIELVMRMRRNIMRYMNLAWVLQMAKNSYTIRCRFKPREHGYTACCDVKKKKTARINYIEMFHRINEDPVVKATYGELITSDEIDVFTQRAKEKENEDNYEPEFWLPLTWCTQIMREAGDLAFMDTSRFYSSLVSMVNDFRSSLGNIASNNQFNIPLVYTQIIIIVVYSFYLSQLFSNQFIQPAVSISGPLTHSEQALYYFNAYIPLVSIMNFLIYMGWFRVGLSLVNPLREDESGFPMDLVLDYNLKISLELGLLKEAYLPRSLVSRSAMEKGLDKNEDSTIDQVAKTMTDFLMPEPNTKTRLDF